jgi:predicted PurR-regulated permease PerM
MTVAVVVTAALYWTQKILIPVALAVFITFLLSPMVTRLQHLRLGRVPSIIAVALLAGLILVGIGWVIGSQIRGLAAGMSQYTENIKSRVQFVRDLIKGGSIGEELDEMGKEVGKVWNPPDEKAEKQQGPFGEDKGPPMKVQVEPGSTWVNRVGDFAPGLAEVLASGALTAVLVIFMLLKREDLRNRLIWLTGRGRIALTTKVLDDIGARISRYLLAQLVINTSYGLAMALGLWAIGVDHWLLWGFLSGLGRYVPYIGAPLAALFPIVLSLAQFNPETEGWTRPLLVVGWIVFLELLANNLMEPWLYGKSIGASEVALLVAAGFWAFLWGPAGLILSGPLTVCLVVVGEYVPALRFLAVLLGDEPALEPDVSYFQRLAAGDQDEAMAIALNFAREHGTERVYDGLLLPGLAHAREALAQGELSDSDERFIIDATRLILDDLEQELERPAGEAEVPAGAEAGVFQPLRKRVRIVGCAARDEMDQLGIEMLRRLLDPLRWEVDVVPVTVLAGELIARIREKQPAVLCIGSLPPGGLAHTRYLCKRLSSAFPGLKLLVGRWGPRGAGDAEREQLREVGAEAVDAALLETADELKQWLPVLQEQALSDRGAVAGRAAEKV